MALVSMRELLDHAAQHHYGIPAFNVNNLEQVQAVMSAADTTEPPSEVKRSTSCSQRPSCSSTSRRPARPSDGGCSA